MKDWFTAEEVAVVLGTTPEWVWNQKAKGVVRSTLTVDREKYDRVAILKLALILALADVFGPKHGAPRGSSSSTRTTS